MWKWSTIKEIPVANKLKPIHPGEILKEEFLIPLGFSAAYLARATKLPPRLINSLLNRKRAMDAHTALRLSRYFGNTPQFWMNLQNDYDLDIARTDIGKRIQREIKTFNIIR
jgi:addiction module HigA family antidote